MNINERQLRESMTALTKECESESPNFRKIIAQAVSLGMTYQEKKIKEGIDIVFNELHRT